MTHLISAARLATYASSSRNGSASTSRMAASASCPPAVGADAGGAAALAAAGAGALAAGGLGDDAQAATTNANPTTHLQASPVMFAPLAGEQRC